MCEDLGIVTCELWLCIFLGILVSRVINLLSSDKFLKYIFNWGIWDLHFVWRFGYCGYFAFLFLGWKSKMKENHGRRWGRRSCTTIEAGGAAATSGQGPTAQHILLHHQSPSLASVSLTTFSLSCDFHIYMCVCRDAVLH